MSACSKEKAALGERPSRRNRLKGNSCPHPAKGTRGGLLSCDSPRALRHRREISSTSKRTGAQSGEEQAEKRGLNSRPSGPVATPTFCGSLGEGRLKHRSVIFDGPLVVAFRSTRHLVSSRSEKLKTRSKSFKLSVTGEGDEIGEKPFLKLF